MNRQRMEHWRESECFDSQQHGDQQPDNVMFWHVFAAFEEGDSQPQREVPHRDRENERHKPRGAILSALWDISAWIA